MVIEKVDGISSFDWLLSISTPNPFQPSTSSQNLTAVARSITPPCHPRPRASRFCAVTVEPRCRPAPHLLSSFHHLHHRISSTLLERSSFDFYFDLQRRLDPRKDLRSLHRSLRLRFPIPKVSRLHNPPPHHLLSPPTFIEGLLAHRLRLSSPLTVDSLSSATSYRLLLLLTRQ